MVPNISATALTLTAASASGNGADQDNSWFSGVQLLVKITAISGTTPTITFIVEGKDPASGDYYAILTSAALNAVASTLLTIYPGATVAANTAVSSPLPKTWRVRYTIAGTTPSVTCTVGANLIK